jgi:hypothetical protein
MKTMLIPSCALLAGAALFLIVSHADARAYGVSASRAGRGTVYHGSGGGSAYVGPRGAVAQGPQGNVAAANRYGGAVVAGQNGAVVRTGGAVVAPLPAGYIRTVPYGYSTVYYGGYNCMYVGGVYYRPVMYQGTTVYVVVR